jgi:hypothetical protein
VGDDGRGLRELAAKEQGEDEVMRHIPRDAVVNIPPLHCPLLLRLFLSP